MAAPNLFAATSLIEKSVGLAVTASAATLIANAAASGTLVRVKSVRVANIHATNTGQITLQVVKNAGTTYRLAFQVNMAIGTSIDLIEGGTVVHLEENDTMQILANATTTFEAWANYDVVS